VTRSEFVLEAYNKPSDNMEEAQNSKKNYNEIFGQFNLAGYSALPCSNRPTRAGQGRVRKSYPVHISATQSYLTVVVFKKHVVRILVVHSMFQTFLKNLTHQMNGF
jgi:hypothetical protein